MKQKFHGPVGQVTADAIHNHGPVVIHMACPSQTEDDDLELEELQSMHERLQRRRRAIYRAFLRHPTVPSFAVSMLLLTGFMLINWGEIPAGAQAFGMGASLLAVGWTTYRMTVRRRPLYDGILETKARLRVVEKDMAVRMAESMYGRRGR